MLNTILKKFYEELNSIRFIKNNFSAITTKDCMIELYFNDKAWKHMDNENSKAYKKFIELIDKYELEYDFISIRHIDVWEE